ncbi:unnamed protein product [Blepharisma stoltei]|uniref:TmcB/TmcC TPR repeats domain-containing protein n=1 Tax=Blepharisma stoltei TaxID=1481888 RepID=A0AAU9JUL8_9CILI|nr:unnamed protein product [Blepharisma stoltei]
MSDSYLFNIKDETEELSSYLRKIKAPKFFQKLLWALFELYRISYYNQNPREKSEFFQKSKFIVINLIFCFQTISLLWIPDLSITNWKENLRFWQYLGYLRIDNWCAALGVMDYCIYISIIIVLVNTAYLLILVLLVYFSIKITRIFLAIFKKINFIWLHFFQIPIITLLILILKYRIFPEKYVSEYSNSYEQGNFQANFIASIFALPLLALSFVFGLFDAGFTGEIRHSIAYKDFKSKAHSKIDCYSVLFSFILSILYAIMALHKTIYFQIIVMIYSAIMLIESIKYFPYFSLFANCVIIVRYWIITAISFLFLFGEMLDKSMVIVMLTITIVPLSSLILIHAIINFKMKTAQKLPTNIKLLKNAYELEINLRYFLCLDPTEINETLINIFSKCYLETKLYRNKLLAVWEANYCTFSLNDEILGKIKLGKAKMSDFDLEGSYQEYVCSKAYLGYNIDENAKFLHYIHKIQVTKAADESLCMVLKSFWRELVSTKPELKKLNNMMRSISKNLKLLHIEYTFLINNYPKSKETLLLYSTLLQSIILDFDKAMILNNKRNSLEKSLEISLKDQKRLNFFDDNNGIILASWEKNTLGKIQYANQKAAAILKQSSDTIIGNSISMYIPPPLDKDFNESMYKYLHHCSKSELKLPSSICLQLSNRNIVECNVRASITSLSDLSTLVIIFRERPVDHQVALLSESGEIVAHSRLFTKLAGKRMSSLQGVELSALFPVLKKMVLLPFIPYKLSNIETETYLVLCYKVINSIRINYVVLVNDPIEIEKWKHRDTEEIQESDQIEDYELDTPPLLRISSSIKTDNRSDYFRNKSTRETLRLKSLSRNDITQTGETTEFTENLNTEKNEDILSNVCSQSSIIFTNSKVLKSLMEKTVKSLKIFQIILIISMLVVLLTNGAVLFYAVDEVNSSSSLEVQNTLGNIAKSFLSVSHFARIIFFARDSASKELFNEFLNGFYGEMKNLKNIHQDILANLSSWTQCSAQKIFSRSEVDLWKIDNDKIVLDKTNLVSALEEFIINGNDFINKYNSNKTVYEEITFFTLNGYGRTFEYCNASLYDLVDCQINHVDNLSGDINTLLIAGFAILCICVGVMIIFYLAADIMKNTFWNHIKSQAYEFYYDLKQSCLDRLISIHGQTDNNSDAISGRTSKNGDFKDRWIYSWRVIVYFLFSLFFFLLEYTYLYQNCAYLLKLRPEFMRELIDIQLQYKSLSIWSGETLARYSPASLSALTPQQYLFSDYNIIINREISKINCSKQLIRKNKYLDFLSSDFLVQFYETLSLSNPILSYGTYAAGNLVIFETYYLDYSGDLDAFNIFINLMLTLEDINNEHDTLISLADQESYDSIQNEVRMIIIALVFYALGSVFLYAGFYVPFLKGERKKMNKMQKISNMIPGKIVSKPSEPDNQLLKGNKLHI